MRTFDMRLRHRYGEMGKTDRFPNLDARDFSPFTIDLQFAVGALVGAVIGALIGLATESGLFRGAGVGAISGAVFAIDAVESTLVIWRTRGMWSVLFVVLLFPAALFRNLPLKRQTLIWFPLSDRYSR